MNNHQTTITTEDLQIVKMIRDTYITIWKDNLLGKFLGPDFNESSRDSLHVRLGVVEGHPTRSNRILELVSVNTWKQMMQQLLGLVKSTKLSNLIMSTKTQINRRNFFWVANQAYKWRQMLLCWHSPNPTEIISPTIAWLLRNILNYNLGKVILQKAEFLWRLTIEIK